MTFATQQTIARVSRFVLVTANAIALARFYARAFGFRGRDSQRLAGAHFEGLLEVSGGALSLTVAAGEETIELLQFDRPGRPYPCDLSASDLSFQHLAVVVDSMDEALTRLHSVDGWTPISSAGPERLPFSSGGVTAFKFRDPEGHPMELLSFPSDRIPKRWQQRTADGPCIGIDHSALCVAEPTRSTEFYRSLGLTIGERSANDGPAQGRLDRLREPRVAVIALEPPRSPPHIELLCYESSTRDADPAPNDIAATRLVFELQTDARAGVKVAAALRDPDGHRLLIVPA